QRTINTERTNTMTAITEVGSMRGAVRDLTKLGYADMIKPVTDKLAGVDAIDAHVAGLVAQAQEARERLVTGIATGTATVEDLALFAAINARGTQGDFRLAPQLTPLANQAKESVHREAYAAGVGLAPGILDKLAQRAATVVKAVAAAKLPANA